MDQHDIEQKILRAVARRPHTAQQLQNNLQVPGAQLRKLLDGMVAAGQLARQGGEYVPGGVPARAGGGAAAAEDLVPCTLSKLAPRFGFAARDDGAGELFIPGRYLHGAMPGDGLLVRVLPASDGDKPTGEVARLTALQNRFAGTVRYDDERCLCVEPDGCRDVLIALQPGQTAGAQAGDKVGVELTARGEHHRDHRAAVRLRFGPAASAAHCAQALVYGRGFAAEFPPAVQAEAAALPDTVDDSEVQAGQRIDLRGVPVFTIDSAETKDIDDAVSILPLAAGGWELGVHIADVSHYVRPGTALDAEALARGTSVYYADRVLPMLPPALSNGICSLNAGVDRLAFSCLMRLDAEGRLCRYDFAKSILRSRVKGVYKEVNLLLDGANDPALVGKYAAVAGQLPAFKALYEKRLALRRARGGMELDSAEGKLVLDESGRCVDIAVRPRGLAECIVEECMLLANQCAGAAGRVNRVPFVYRVHEAPPPEKLERLQAMLTAAGVTVRFADPAPTQQELAALLESVKGQPNAAAVSTAVLRSLPRARYAPQPLGHYGLALRDYAHFTSPIRRYPDLAVHRILTDLLHGVRAERLVEDYSGFAAHAAAQATLREELAVQLERDAEALYKAEYAHAHLGEECAGTVSGLTPHGAFVQLENTLEGFVPAAQLCRGEPELTDGVALHDPLTGRTWRLGDAMRVRIAGADVALGQVDFEKLAD